MHQASLQDLVQLSCTTTFSLYKRVGARNSTLTYTSPPLRVCCPLQDLSWVEFKERYLRPNYLQLNFAVGALTIGLRVAGANYTFTSTVSIIRRAQKCLKQFQPH
jgi:hypothetical protein